MSTKLSLRNYSSSEHENRRRGRALLSGAIAGLSTAFVAFADNGCTTQEGIGIALSVVIAIGGVYGVRSTDG